MDFKAQVIFAPLMEALKFVKRSKDQGKDDREYHKATTHADDIDKEAEDLFVANMNGTLIVKSRHMKEIRDGQKNARDADWDNDYMIKVFKKLFLKPAFRPGKSMVAFRNKKGKYDLIAINYDARFKTLKVITYIKKGRRGGYEAFSTNRDYDKNPKIVIEALSEMGLDAQLAEELLEYNQFVVVD